MTGVEFFSTEQDVHNEADATKKSRYEKAAETRRANAAARRALEAAESEKRARKNALAMSPYPNCCRQNPNCCRWSFVFLLFVTILTVVVTVSTSYNYTEWNEYSIFVNTYSNELIDETVHENGQEYVIEPSKVVAYPRNLLRLNISLDLFTQSGLEFKVPFVMYYNLQKNSIVNIYRNFKNTIYSEFESRANADTKNVASRNGYTVRDYVVNRMTIQRVLHGELNEKISEIGINISPDRFFLGMVEIPSGIINASLSAAIALQNNLEEQYSQQIRSVESETNRLESERLSQIDVIRGNASSTAERTILKATAEGQRDILASDTNGFQSIVSFLNITDPTLKTALFEYYSILDIRNQTTA